MNINRFRSQLHGALIVLAVLGLLASTPAQAARAGIVVDLGNGQVVTECVHFGGPMITAFDLLQRSGLAFTFQNFGSLGAAICSVQSTGCQFPTEACFCQCTGRGPCNFFAFYTLQNGQFVLSNVGVSSSVLHNKDVIALAFGDASTAPAPLSIKDICKNDND
jgi:hypothetical protein